MKKTKVVPTTDKNLALIIDGANFIHRAQSGFQMGDFSIVFNFFRNLRAVIGEFLPGEVFFVLEGYPKARHTALTQYKANRRLEVPEDESQITPELQKKIDSKKNYFRQADLIIDLLKNAFSMTVVRHADHECDDVIHNLIAHNTTENRKFVVVSNDSDFTQLLCEFDNVRVYNPMLKEFVEKPEVDYVTWKALRGDGSDNIPGIPGIGDKKADELCLNSDKLAELFSDPNTASIFERNYNLIKFHTFSKEELEEMETYVSLARWDYIKEKFVEWQFNSIVKEGSWEKFMKTFNDACLDDSSYISYMNMIKRCLQFAWNSPITILGLLYVLIFTLLKWYQFEGMKGDAIVWKVNLKTSPRFILNLWAKWAGQTIGNVVVLKYTPESDRGAVTLKHEQQHVKQGMKLGIFLPILYAISYVSIWLACEHSDPYFSNVFEIDARRASGQIVDVEGEKKN